MVKSVLLIQAAIS